MVALNLFAVTLIVVYGAERFSDFLPYRLNAQPLHRHTNPVSTAPWWFSQEQIAAR
ncbi:MAG TPA: hypothetical protein VIX91_14995 [Candidatus Acidoferrum sp.]